tara:strand:+ start:227 stop:517 length:291 start_codon:yes stop_codon:yes gene_type:complete
MTVQLIKMWTGEDVIAELLEEKGRDSIVIKNPIVAVPTDKAGNIGFAPWSPLVGRDTELEVTRRYVVYIDKPQEELVQQYNQMFGNISTPHKKLIL